MGLDLLDLYRQTSAWTADNVGGAKDLDATTPCDEWSVRDLLNHMLDTQRYFLEAARGEDAAPPGPNPPDVLSATTRARTSSGFRPTSSTRSARTVSSRRPGLRSGSPSPTSCCTAGMSRARPARTTRCPTVWRRRRTA